VEFHTVRRGYVDPDDEGDFLQELFSASRDHHGKWDEIQAAKKEIQRRKWTTPTATTVTLRAG